MKFTLGQSVVISRRFTGDPCSLVGGTDFKPWREGSITAVGDKAVRVRTITRLPWGKVRWIHLDHPLWQITSIQE